METRKNFLFILRYGDQMMRRLLLLPLLAGLLGGTLSAATVQFDVISLGSNSYRYIYSLSGISFVQYQTFEVEFSAALFGALSNPTAGSGFDALVFQPNDPPNLNLPGLYSSQARQDNPALAPFTVDVSYLGTGLPGVQPFTINLFDSAQRLISSETGTTTAQVTNTPEPASVGMAGGALLLGIFWCAARRRARRAV
jgi:hypothetical protein